MNRFSDVLSGLILGLVMMALSGCVGAPPTRFFILSPVSDLDMREKEEGEPCVAIGINPLKIPEYLNQPKIVTRISGNEVRVDEFAKWVEPLENTISRALAQNLSSLLCTRAVVIFPFRGGRHLDYRIDLRVIRMDGMLGGNAILEAAWSIANGADRRKPPLLTTRSSYKEPTGGKDHGAFVSAQSRNLYALSRDIAAAILTLSR